MESALDILLSKDPLNMDRAYAHVTSDATGGIAVFVGTVRDHTANKSVLRLDFSAYEPMAIKEMTKIGKQALQRFDIQRIAIHHGIGSMEIGEKPVIIAVASAHRQAAFEACQFAIDTLKETVPIWKKEYFEDGEVWVNAHP